MTQVLGLTVMLGAFWLLLSGHYAPLFLIFGTASVLLVTWLSRRMDIVDHEGRPLELSLRAPRYSSGLRFGVYFQNCFDAILAPSASAASFAHTTSGSTAACPTQVP